MNKSFWLTITAPGWVPVWLFAKGVQWTLGGVSGQSGPNTHGDASFAEYDQLKKAGYLNPEGGFYIGRTVKRVIWWKNISERVFTDPEASVIIVGRKGTGKSQTIIANIKALKLWRKQPLPDLIITDPVGEIQGATQHDLEAMGYYSLVLDLKDPVKSFRHDPLTIVAVGSPTFDMDCAALCELLLPDKGSDRNEHFTEFPRTYLTGVLVHMLRHRNSETTLASVLLAATASKDKRAPLIKAMREDSHRLVQMAADAYDEVGDRERGSFLTTMARNFKPFLYDNIRWVCTPGLDNDDRVTGRGWTFKQMFMRPAPTAVFIRTGLEGAVTGPFVRMTMGNAINTKRRLLDTWDGKGPINEIPGLQRGLRIFVDEARTVGNCQAVVDANNELRKANVNVMLCYLSRADIFNNFKDAKTLLGGCALIVAGGAPDYETAEEISRLIGEKTVFSYGASEGKGGASESRHETGVRLIKPEKIRQLPKNEWLVVMDAVQARLLKPRQYGKWDIPY